MQMSTKTDFEPEKVHGNDDKPDLTRKNDSQAESQPNKKQIVPELRVENLESEDNALESSTRLSYLKKCPIHPEEDLQFYCFSNSQVLCSECLVSGKYVGLEIANIRKAADRLKGRFNEFVAETIDKSDDLSPFEKEISNYREEVKRTILTYEEEISNFFTEIREKINIQERELMNNLVRMREERFSELTSMETFLKNYKETIHHEKTSLNDELKTLDDLEFCQYYIHKTDAIKCLLAEKGTKAEVIKEKVGSYQLQDEFNLSRLQDEFKSVSTHFDSLGGLDIFQLKQTHKEDLKLNKIPSFFSNIGTDKTALKESRESLFIRPPTPVRLNISQKPSFLPEDPVTSGGLPRSPSNNVFDKHMAKVQEIRRQTPKQEPRTETQIKMNLETKKTDSRSSLILDIKKNILNKKFSGLVLNNDSSPGLDNILNKMSESKTPTTFMTSSLTPSNKSLGSSIYSPSSQKTTSLISSLTTKSTDKLELLGFDSSNRHVRLDKNPYDLQNIELSRRTSTKLKRENESLKTLNVDQMFSKRKTQERNEVASFNDGGMKKKLDNLSISLFK